MRENIDMGEYREIESVKVGELVLTGFQFNCDDNYIFFCINGIMCDDSASKNIYGKRLNELFPDQHKDVVAKMEKHEKQIAKLMWKDETTR